VPQLVASNGILTEAILTALNAVQVGVLLRMTYGLVELRHELRELREVAEELAD